MIRPILQIAFVLIAFALSPAVVLAGDPARNPVTGAAEPSPGRTLAGRCGYRPTVAEREERGNHDFPWSVVAAIVGAIVGGLISYVTTLHSGSSAAKRAMSIELHSEFHAQEMLACRSTAKSLLHDHRKNIDSMEKEHNQLFVSLSRLLHFFERIESLRACHALDDKLLRELLGQYIRFWFDNAYGVLSKGVGPQSPHWDLLKKFESANRHLGKQPASTYRIEG